MAVPITMTDTRAQQLLALQPAFQSRVQIALCSVATTVLTEQGVGATHARRANYAVTVLNNPPGVAQAAAVTLAGSTNVKGTITITDEGPVTSVTDAALESQVSSLWNVLAGVDTGS
jgi:hypothetical protein